MNFKFSGGEINITDSHPDILACKNADDLEALNLLTNGTKADYKALWGKLKPKENSKNTAEKD